MLFIDGATQAPTVLTTTPETGETSVATDVRPTAMFSRPVAPATVQFTLTDGAGTSVTGATTYDAASGTATFTPTVALGVARRYTATVAATDTKGRPMPEPATWEFTTARHEQVSTLFGAGDTPAVASSGDNGGITVGVKFTPTVDGKVVGVRYYRGEGNDGTHTGTLYAADGTRLAKATFGGGTASGWQSVEFAEPVDVTAGTTYVVAYWAPGGSYSFSPGFFDTGWTSSDRALTAPSGINGLYLYGSDGFPTSSWNATNYWVDAMFVGDGPPPGPPMPPSRRPDRGRCSDRPIPRRR